VTLEETQIKMKSTTKQTAQANSKTNLRWNKLTTIWNERQGSSTLWITI